MKTIRIFLLSGIIISLFGCGAPNREEKSESASFNDTTAAAYISSSAAMETNKDSDRKFIRTADLKFKVKNVIKATYTIEDITVQQGGFVTFTSLNSQVDNVVNTPISEDSILETTYFSVINTITIRVPNTRLDTTLKLISQHIDYLDYRIIKADDIALQLLSNNLTQKRVAKSEQRISNAIDNRGKKLKETTTAEELLINKQEQADNAKISNLSLTDQVNFSTISLYLYQRQTIRRELIANNINIDAYEPGFGKKMLEALKKGWNILEALFLFLCSMWSLIIVGIIAYLLYKKYKSELRKYISTKK
jgi:hypothetical protein